MKEATCCFASQCQLWEWHGPEFEEHHVTTGRKTSEDPRDYLPEESRDEWEYLRERFYRGDYTEDHWFRRPMKDRQGHCGLRGKP